MNAAERLAREISRVSKVIVHYEYVIEEARKEPNPRLSPLTETIVVPMLKGQLENAIKAVGTGEALDTIKAIAVLQGIH